MYNDVVAQEESWNILTQFQWPDNPEHKATFMLLLEFFITHQF